MPEYTIGASTAFKRPFTYAFELWKLSDQRLVTHSLALTLNNSDDNYRKQTSAISFVIWHDLFHTGARPAYLQHYVCSGITGR